MAPRRPSRASSQTVTPLPAARPSALTTTPSPSAASSRANASAGASVGERAGARHPDAGRARRSRGRTPCCSRSGPPRRVGPKTAIPAARERVGDPAASGASGPMTTSSAASRRATRHDRAGRRAGRPATQRTRGSAAIAVAPGRDDDLVDARLGRELPGQRVLAAAAAHDEDPGRHQEAGRAHAGIPGRWRIGRQARSIVWVRSGPTETSTIGTPACASIALT